ncbi:MAG: hypothetical protein CL944_01950 [Candidatus Diapherotrites archaeon]|uniref:Radical SAM core domain-containing protein n=1 Tax=Candidatus Iainarchaeum sp. TaxID=3101447 RepID=A0A2D6LPV8_9ARCH|nr:hypothetical protein [Candidatus Diapherotrites archaeon]|tara:strand:+ start:9370 stop:10353 length:984 start_codon:yes stop_codon:yes gene_type:complete
MLIKLRENFDRALDITSKKGLPGLTNAVLVKTQKHSLPEKVYGNPDFIQIETSTACNLKCVMCPLNFPKESKEELFPHLSKPSFLSFEKFKKILEVFPTITDVRLSGIGEPLMNPDLLKMVSYCTEKKLNTQFNTNATFLTEQKSVEVIESGLSQLIISFDGYSKETFENIRIGANYEKVLNNISNFIKTRKKLNSNSPGLVVTAVRMKRNQHEMDKLEKKFLDLGVDNVIIKDVVSPSTGELTKERTYTKEQLTECKCRWPWSAVYINLEGNVSPCCYAPHVLLGNVFEEGKEIWNNKKYTEFRKKMVNGTSSICNNCPEYGVANF